MCLWNGTVLTRQGAFIEQHRSHSESGCLGPNLGSAPHCPGTLAEDSPPLPQLELSVTICIDRYTLTASIAILTRPHRPSREASRQL